MRPVGTSGTEPSRRSDAGGRAAARFVARPGLWVPTAYLAEGIPFALVIWVAGTMFKDQGFGDSKITATTASIGIVWSLKPLWAPALEMYRTKRAWVVICQVTMAAALAAIVAILHGRADYFAPVVALLWLIAFLSASQD